MDTPVIARVPRSLRNLDLPQVEAIATAEGVNVPDALRMLLSFGTYRWRSGWRGPLGDGTHSVKLLPGGVEAIKTLGAVEKLAWDVMAAQVVAFAVDNWETGWRRESPGKMGRSGVQALRASVKA